MCEQHNRKWNNDNTSTSSYSSASDDSDHISNTTKGSGVAASISSSSSYPISVPGIQPSLHTASSLLPTSHQQPIQKPYKNETNPTHNIIPSSGDHFNSEHIGSKNDHQQQQHQQQRNIQNKKGPFQVPIKILFPRLIAASNEIHETFIAELLMINFHLP